MTPTIFQKRFFIFTIVFVYSLPLFALAAPLPDTPRTSSLLRKREALYDSGLYAERSVHSRDDEVLSDVLARAPAASYGSGRGAAVSRHVLSATEREAQNLVGRSIFSRIGHAIKRVGRTVGRVVHGVKQGIKTVRGWANTIGSIGKFVPGFGKYAAGASKAIGPLGKIIRREGE